MIIYAVNIHSGGGRILLDQVLIDEHFGAPKILICDKRYQPPPSTTNIEIYPIPPSLLKRWEAEFLLRHLSESNPNFNIVCFANLPPLLKLKGKTTLFLQNALLLNSAPFFIDSLKNMLRLFYEKIWLNLFIKNIDDAVVQTESMRFGLSQMTKKNIDVRPIPPKLPNLPPLPKKYDFICVTGVAPHKRLKLVIEAWEQLATPPKLLLITDTDLNDQNLNKKNITNVTDVSREELFNYYRESRFLLVASKIESYCLPIYEAKHFGLKVLAPDEPYARDAQCDYYFKDNLVKHVNAIYLENPLLLL